ncbi:unnamed protein product, partial [Rotaria sp. Silwood1]
MENQQLLYQEIVGEIAPYCDTEFVSTVFDPQTRFSIDEDQSKSLTSTSETNIRSLLTHLDDQQDLAEAWQIFTKHHRLFDTTTITIAETDTPQVICTENKPPTASRPY